jgi:hypothetical protein
MRRTSQKEYRAKWLSEGKCNQCARPLESKEFKRCPICRMKRKEYRMRNLERERTSSKIGSNRCYHRLRNKILELLGNKCSRCGFSDIRALQIDHVNGKGLKEIRSMNNWKYLHRVLDEISKGSKDYQCLCANCNQIKKIEKKEF